MRIIEVTNVDFSLRHFLLPLMRGLRARGHEVIGVCADGALLAEVRAEGFCIKALPLARSLSPVAQLRAFLALYRLFRTEKPDLVHAHMPISGFLARIAARAAGVKYIAYTCHGFLFNQPAPWPRRAASFCMELLAGRLTDIFFTVSHEEARDSRRLRIFASPIAIGNGRNPAQFHPDPKARAAIRSALGVPEDRVVITAVSRLVRHKGYPELLAAMRDVPAELWVVGERLPSDHGENMEAYFAASGLGERLRRLGYRHDVAAILAASDIFVLPSHFEGLPMSVIEAMLCALPVVATNIRGPREQVVDGCTGFLVPPATVAPLAEALRRLAGDAPLRAQFGEAGLARALKMFRENVVVGATVEALERKAFFFEKKKQKNFYVLREDVATCAKIAKVFWFFFAKKNSFFFLFLFFPMARGPNPRTTPIIRKRFRTRCKQVLPPGRRAISAPSCSAMRIRQTRSM